MKSIIVLFQIVFINFCFAQELTSFNSGNVSFNLAAEQNSFNLYIKPLPGLKNKELTANSFLLKNPNRLVIDLPGVKASRQNNLKLNTPYLSAIRVGKHANKIRAVIDIKSHLSPNYDIVADQNTESLVLKFNFGQKIISQDARPQSRVSENNNFIPSKEVISEAKPVIASSTEADKVITMKGNEKISALTQEQVKSNMEAEKLVKTNSTEIITEPTESIPEPVLEPVTSSVINNILFRTTQKQDSLEIQASKINDYKITQKGKNLYELEITNTTLAGDHLTLPQFPPNSFKNFEVVLTNQAENNVIIKIYLNSEVDLEASIVENKLIITNP